MHPYSMKGFSGTVVPHPYFNAKTDAEAIEAALVLRRGSIASKIKQMFGLESEYMSIGMYGSLLKSCTDAINELNWCLLVL